VQEEVDPSQIKAQYADGLRRTPGWRVDLIEKALRDKIAQRYRLQCGLRS